MHLKQQHVQAVDGMKEVQTSARKKGLPVVISAVPRPVLPAKSDPRLSAISRFSHARYPSQGQSPLLC